MSCRTSTASCAAGRATSATGTPPDSSTRSATTRSTASRGSSPSATSAAGDTAGRQSPTNRRTGSGRSTSTEPSSRHDPTGRGDRDAECPRRRTSGSRVRDNRMHGSMSAAGKNQASRASTRRTVQAPPADPTATVAQRSLPLSPTKGALRAGALLAHASSRRQALVEPIDISGAPNLKYRARDRLVALGHGVTGAHVQACRCPPCRGRRSSRRSPASSPRTRRAGTRSGLRRAPCRGSESRA
jgi:hypothetical protein